MNRKVWTKVILSTIGILIICIIVAVHLFNNKITKEVNVAKHFISVLSDKKMIKSGVNADKINFDVVKQTDGDKEYYKISSKNYGIDLDSKLNVIGFNYIYRGFGDASITEAQGKKVAEKYIEYLETEEYRYDSNTGQSDSKAAYYGYIFTRYKNGYPFYNDKIMVQIDKVSSYLTAYSNSKLQGNPKPTVISVNEDDAEKTALKVFNKINTNGIIDSKKTYKAYCDNKDSSSTELCYVITVTGKDNENKDIRMKYFVTTDDGKVLNLVKDNVTKISVN